MAHFVGNPVHRMLLRDALVSRYFSHARPLLLLLFAGPNAGRGLISSLPSPDPSPGSRRLHEDPPLPLPGRNSAFRRKILETYDWQCAASSLRIRFPGTDNLTCIDASRLIPFTSRFNDHPTNGTALWKNRHWAMDRFLIAPTPDFRWMVSAS